MDNQPEWITIEHARKLVRVSRRTIYNWVAKNQVEHRRTASGSIRILASSLWQKPGLPLDSQSTAVIR